jgi:importin-9
MESLPRKLMQPLQPAIFNAVADFISSHDLKEDLEESDDVKGALITALREAILLDTSNIVDSSAIDTLLTLASDGATSFLLAQQIEESFEAIAESMSSQSAEAYGKLCSKTIPALSGAFDIGDMTSESALTNLAAQLISTLAEFGTDPLPDGFVAAVMPKLQRVLMHATEDALIQPATTAVTHVLKKGTAQFMEWKDTSGTSSLEVVLTIINRLLNAPEIDEQAAQEVGGLASIVVEKYGSEKLGPYLPDLLQALAARLHPAQQIQFIQSLLMVFVGLTLTAPKDVVDFLSALTIANQNGLNVVLSKWLENSILFAGFEEVRLNTVALSKLFALQDERVKSIGVKGDLIVENTGRIKTRSQAKLNPDRYTTISADVKILKILVEELRTSAESSFQHTAAGALVDAESEGSDDDEGWEDEPGGIDLGSAAVKEELMAFAGEDGGRRVRDEETVEYLGRWFREVGAGEGLQAAFAGLNQEEQGTLTRLVG